MNGLDIAAFAALIVFAFLWVGEDVRYNERDARDLRERIEQEREAQYYDQGVEPYDREDENDDDRT